jgi:hypothetical protein
MVDRKQRPRVVDDPQPCFIRMQLVRHGVFVAARIFHRLGMLVGEINGKSADPLQIWHSGSFITEACFNDMMRNPEPDPYRVVHISDAGMADRIREADENDFWWWRNFA